MIARNYIKHPEALRFQHEMFSNGYHNSPRIMRLMECIFNWTPSAPDWWTAAKAKARTLAKAVKKSIADFFKETKVIQLKFGFMGEGMTLTLPTTPRLTRLQADPATSITDAIEKQYLRGEYVWLRDVYEMFRSGGCYKSFCNGEHHSSYYYRQNYQSGDNLRM